MDETDAEGPIPLGEARDLIWFARGRVAVGVPRTAYGAVHETVLRLAERYERVGEKLAFAIIIKGDTERPGNEIDREIRRAFEELAPMVACSAIAILATGFFAGFFISMSARAVSFMRQDVSKPQIHSSLESAAAWMHERLGDPNTSAEEILETLRWAEADAN